MFEIHKAHLCNVAEAKKRDRNYIPVAMYCCCYHDNSVPPNIAFVFKAKSINVLDAVLNLTLEMDCEI